MKTTQQTKARITKLYKQGKSIDEILTAIRAYYSKITATRINQVVYKHLFNQADELWSQAVKVGGRCEISSKNDRLESHHLIKRSNFAFRWVVINGVCLNAYIHRDVEADEGMLLKWLRVYKPEQWSWYQEHKRQGGRQVSNEDLLQICIDLKQYIGRMKHADKRSKGIGERRGT